MSSALWLLNNLLTATGHSCNTPSMRYGKEKFSCCADGNGAAVKTGSFGWWPFVKTGSGSKCTANGFWGPNGGAVTGTTGNGGFAAAEARKLPHGHVLCCMYGCPSKRIHPRCALDELHHRQQVSWKWFLGPQWRRHYRYNRQRRLCGSGSA